MSRGIRRRVRVVAVLVLAGSAAACDGYLAVEGRVYASPSPSEAVSSFALIDSIDTVLPPDLTPVEGCEVIVEPWTPGEREERADSGLWTGKATTDASGYFKAGSTTKPGWYDSTITVRCPDHKPIEHVFRHDRLRHYAIAVVVPQ